MIQNRDIYQKDPSTHKLINQGVANVNDDTSTDALAVLRYELETFVCHGQYEKGMEHLLETYLKNIDQPQQPAVWVSGFFGSGKSHLVKMLRALWVDTPLAGGATARNIANLPPSITDLLRELTTRAKQHGGVHAASGTLGSGANNSARLALLSIIFKSVGLHEKYWVARFTMWLKSEGIYEQVKDIVETSGYDWAEEMDNFLVSGGLREALVKAKPQLFSSTESCGDILKNQYPCVKDVSSDDMISAIRQALSVDGKFPLTLIVLDEVQQFIGENSQRSIEVQEMVEACCKNIGGKLLFIGTGQTAVTGTPNLKKLEGRFTVRIELSDADVEAVIRQVILAKKPGAIKEVEQVIESNLGEVSRHLSGTSIGHSPADLPFFPPDYPILPVRRRFWEATLQVLDQTGTDSQLRNQLSMVHKAIQTNLDCNVGHVIPADYLYFESADKLLQTRKLPRKVHEKTMSWIKGSEDDKLCARACGLVFLINKLASKNSEIGIKATVDTLADLMIEDLSQGSSSLRNRLPDLLKDCELLLRVGDEYRIQTEESADWMAEFEAQRSQLASEAFRIEIERDTRIRQKVGEHLKKVSLAHGKGKVPREVSQVFDAQFSPGAERKITVWIRNGWSTSEESVRADARQAGNQSPTIFVFIPRLSADALRHHLIEDKAATATLEKRGVPTSPEGSEARAAMETTKQSALGKVAELLSESLASARVFQGGGSEVVGDDLAEAVKEAAQNALIRLYPQFDIADHSRWDRVYACAREGDADALRMVGEKIEPSRNPVCKTILNTIGSRKKGADIRDHFEASPYGWSRDAIDGGLQVLMLAGSILAEDDHRRTVEPKDLQRKAIGKTEFSVAAATVTPPQRIQIRKVLQSLNVHVTQGTELSAIPEFLKKAANLADCAGGEGPQPKKPDTSLLKEIGALPGNAQLLAVYESRDELKAALDEWTETASKIESRLPDWEKLSKLLNHADDIAEAEEAKQEVRDIVGQRLLLADPNLVQPLLRSMEDAVRQALDTQQNQYASALAIQMSELEDDSSWKQLDKAKRMVIRNDCCLNELREAPLKTFNELLEALKRHSPRQWKDRLDALPRRISQALVMAAKSLKPETRTVALPRRTLSRTEDVDVWVKEIQKQLIDAVAMGPVVVQ